MQLFGIERITLRGLDPVAWEPTNLQRKFPRHTYDWVPRLWTWPGHRPINFLHHFSSKRKHVLCFFCYSYYWLQHLHLDNAAEGREGWAGSLNENQSQNHPKWNRGQRIWVQKPCVVTSVDTWLPMIPSSTVEPSSKPDSGARVFIGPPRSKNRTIRSTQSDPSHPNLPANEAKGSSLRRRIFHLFPSSIKVSHEIKQSTKNNTSTGIRLALGNLRCYAQTSLMAYWTSVQDRPSVWIHLSSNLIKYSNSNKYSIIKISKCLLFGHCWNFYLRTRDLRIPASIVLIIPWLRISYSNSDSCKWQSQNLIHVMLSFFDANFASNLCLWAPKPSPHGFKEILTKLSTFAMFHQYDKEDKQIM